MTSTTKSPSIWRCAKREIALAERPTTKLPTPRFANSAKPPLRRRPRGTYGLSFGLETLWRDFSFALRTLRKKPGFAAVAILTLGLGIGESTGIFSMTDNVLLEVS
jgi:hypothetical protein